MNIRDIVALIDQFEAKPNDLEQFLDKYPFWVDDYYKVSSEYKDESSARKTYYNVTDNDETSSTSINHEATLLAYAIKKNKPAAALMIIPKAKNFERGYKTLEWHESVTNDKWGKDHDDSYEKLLSEESTIDLIDNANNQELTTAFFNRIIELKLYTQSVYKNFIRKHIATQNTNFQAGFTESELNKYLDDRYTEMNPARPAPILPPAQTVAPIVRPKPKRPLTNEEKSNPQTEGDTFNLEKSSDRALALKNKYIKLSGEEKKDYKIYTPLKNSFGTVDTLFSGGITDGMLKNLHQNVTGPERVFAFDKENTEENRIKILGKINKK